MLQNQKSNQSSSAVLRLSKKLGVAYATSMKYLQATAQEKVLSDIVSYVWRQQRSGLMQAVACVVRHSYDETKLRLRVNLDSEFQHAGSGSDGAKIFVSRASPQGNT